MNNRVVASIVVLAVLWGYFIYEKNSSDESTSQSNKEVQNKVAAQMDDTSTKKSEKNISQKIASITKKRVVTLGSHCTATVVAFGLKDNLVGVDFGSEKVEGLDKKIPKLGHGHQIPVEGVLSLEPEVVFVDAMVIKRQPAIKHIVKAGVEMVTTKNPKCEADIYTNIMTIGQSLGISTQSAELVQSIKKEMKSFQAELASIKDKPKVLFVYARGVGTVLAAGEDTGADALIKMAGAQNAVSGYKSYKPVTSESLVESNPDVILMFKDGMDSLDGMEGLVKIPGMEFTNAVIEGKIVLIEGFGFGPEIMKTLRSVARQFHGENLKLASQQ